MTCGSCHPHAVALASATPASCSLASVAKPEGFGRRHLVGPRHCRNAAHAATPGDGRASTARRGTLSQLCLVLHPDYNRQNSIGGSADLRLTTTAALLSSTRFRPPASSQAGLLAQRKLTTATIAPTSGSLRTGQSSEEIINGSSKRTVGSSAVLRTKATTRRPLSTVAGIGNEAAVPRRSTSEGTVPQRRGCRAKTVDE